jgi:acyl-CoA synthetase (AMP-forming)/AMP-acid ligase II
MAAIVAGALARPIASDEVFAFPFPLCHVAGYNVLRLHRQARPVALLERFEPKSFVNSIARHQVTSASLAATMLASFLAYLDDHPEAIEQVATIRSLSYGASPMPVELLERVSQLLDVDLSQGYGMTELSGNAVFLDAADHRRGLEHDPTLLSAAGRPGRGVEVEVRDQAGKPVAIGESGEIVVKGAQVMVGYLDDEAATKRTIIDGWLATGDGGRWRPDGILEVVDRLKDVIVTGGENVASLEVERAIRTTFDEVVDVAVVGVPDPTWGENVCAVIVERHPGSLSLERLAEGLDGVLAGFKIPRHLVVVESLPMTHSGKAAKATLRSWLLDEPQRLGPSRSRGHPT